MDYARQAHHLPEEGTAVLIRAPLLRGGDTSCTVDYVSCVNLAEAFGSPFGSPTSNKSFFLEHDFC